MAEVTWFTAIDFETTGTIFGYENEPWQIGLVSFCVASGGDEVCLKHDFDLFSSYLHVPRDRPFNSFSPGRHGEMRELLASSPKLIEIWDKVFPYLNNERILIAHNVGVERTILRKAAPLNRFGPWIDTLKLTKEYYPNLSSYALTDVVKTFGLMDKIGELCPGLAPHDALYDAVACAIVYLKLSDII